MSCACNANAFELASSENIFHPPGGVSDVRRCREDTREKKSI